MRVAAVYDVHGNLLPALEAVIEALSGVGTDAVVCGHTQVQFDRVAGSKLLVNAGSVGMPYEAQRAARSGGA